jgi:predicted ArsR family transcriptional regulator
MTATRRRILEYLENHTSATSVELSHALGVTAADIRHHLTAFVKENVIVVVGERPPAGRGRPSQLYSLVHRAMADNFDLLAKALLNESLDQLNSEESSAFINAVAMRLAGETRRGGGLTTRLFQAVQRLNQLNYQARWEAHAGAPKVFLGRCPYAAILPEHPELCQLDASLLEALLGAPVAQVAKLARDPRGGTYCLFNITGSRPPAEKV